MSYALCPAECFKIPWYFQEEGWLLNFFQYFFKITKTSVFRKKRKTKNKKPHPYSNMLTSILTYEKPKILLKWQSIFSSRYVGVMGCLVFSKWSRCNYLQIKEILTLSGESTATFSLYQRAQVVALSCACKRKLQSSEAVSCCWETQACNPKKSKVKTYIIPTRNKFPTNILLYAHNSLWNKGYSIHAEF